MSVGWVFLASACLSVYSLFKKSSAYMSRITFSLDTLTAAVLQFTYKHTNAYEVFANHVIPTYFLKVSNLYHCSLYRIKHLVLSLFSYDPAELLRSCSHTSLRHAHSTTVQQDPFTSNDL